MLKQAQVFDIEKFELGQFIKIECNGNLIRGLVTHIQEDAITIYAFINNKFVHVDVLARGVIKIDTSTIIPAISVNAVHQASFKGLFNL